jgi:hypothetical protein
MVSSEVQRTLVKSPPELWAEISDPESLARHLGEFGEIRITRVKPEQKVEWEADDARGSVVIKPSGWGTKVKLTVTRELPAPDHAPTPAPDGAPAPSDAAPDATEADAEAEPAAVAEPEAVAEPAAVVEPEAVVEPADAHPLDALLGDGPPGAGTESGAAESDEAEPSVAPAQLAESEPEPHRGFFARLFGRGRTRRPAPRDAFAAAALVTGGDALAESSPHYDDAVAAQASDDTAQGAEPVIAERADELAAAAQASGEAAVSSEATGTSEPELSHRAAPAAEHGAPPAARQSADDTSASGCELAADIAAERPTDIAAEIRAAEEVAAEQVTAVLTGVLDRLGAAHHRPFSRS